MLSIQKLDIPKLNQEYDFLIMHKFDSANKIK